MKKVDYKELLPHGYQSLVAERAGVTRQVVSRFVNGRSTNIKVELAILDVLSELKAEREEKMIKAGLV